MNGHFRPKVNQNLTRKVKIKEPISLLIFNEIIEVMHTKRKTKAVKILRFFFVLDFPHFLTKNVGMLLSIFLDRHNVPTGISLQSNGNELQQNWSCFCFSYANLLFQLKFQHHNDTVCYKTDSRCWDVMVDIFLISTGKLKYFMTWFFSIDFFKYNIVHAFVHTWLPAPISKQFMNIFNILLNFVPYFFTIICWDVTVKCGGHFDKNRVCV